jgi:lipoprotein NlpD
MRAGPRGSKRPYSAAALAEAQAADLPVSTSASQAASQAVSQPAPNEATSPRTESLRGATAGFGWPAAGRVVRGFAEPAHPGLTIEGAAGDPVFAAADGRVIFSGTGPRGYEGNLLIIKHDAETVSVYAHNQALLVKEGQAVKQGQRIAEFGSDAAQTPVLQFEIRKQGRPVDPIKFLPKR